VNDHGTSLTRRLRLLGNQMMLLASEVAQQHAPAADLPMFASLTDDSDLWLVAAQDLYRARRRRSAFFTGDLFGEPAWDMLLDLYIAEKRNERISITSACMAADVPLTTALRWAKQLEAHGLVERTPDEKDGRRFFLRISEEGYARMTAYFARDRASWTADEVPRQKVRLLIQNDIPEQQRIAKRSAAG